MRQTVQVQPPMINCPGKSRHAMADNKHKLAGLLPDEPVKPVIRRGQGIRLSTDVQSEEHTDQAKNQEMEKSRNVEKEKREKVEREKPGYAIRKDLLLAAK